MFAFLLGATLLLVFIYTIPDIQWGTPAAMGSGTFADMPIATFLTATGLVAAAPISYFYNGPDWVRYLPTRTSSRAILSHVTLATALPSIAVCAMGMVWATFADMKDPVAGLRPFVPTPLFVAYIFAVIGGSLANNIPTYYSSGLSLQAMGLHVHRAVATGLDVGLSTMLATYVVFVQDFTTALGNLVACMIIWAGPYAGVWISDGFRCGWQFDQRAIHAVGDVTGKYWGWHCFGLHGLISMLAGMIAAIATMHCTLFEGPVARLMGHADTSWFTGIAVAALIYRSQPRGRSVVEEVAPGGIGIKAPIDALH